MTTAIDLNAQFAASKLDQISAAADKAADIARRVNDGELRDNGNGTYTVLTGWDRNETIRFNGVDVLAEHGLDLTENGTAALYSRVKAWHGLGNIIPDGIFDIDLVLRLAGADFEVSKRPLFYRDPITGDEIEVPDHFAAVRENPFTNLDDYRLSSPLGVVGNVYTHAQNRQAFSFLPEMLGVELAVAYGDIDGLDRPVYESAGVMRGGKRVFVGMRLPSFVTIDAGGVKDQVVPFIYVLNSHDGSGKLTVIVTPWRIECKNTERFAIEGAITSWGVRHTTNWNSDKKQEEARRSLGLAVKYFERFKAEEEVLAQADITMREFWDLVRDLYPEPESDTKRSKSLDDRRMGTIGELFAGNISRLGRTAYAAERTLTEFLDWKKDVRPGRSFKGDLMAARTTLAIEGAEDDTKSRVHRQLLTLVRG